MFIYLITNLSNDKKYVGQTVQNPQERWRQHLKDSKNPKMVISHAINKYGVDNFKFEVIDECLSIDALNEAESGWIYRLDTFNNGYNSTSGGDRNFIITEEFKKRVSDGLKKYYETYDVYNKGVPLSEEHKEKLRQYRLGTKHTEEWKCNASKRCKESNSVKRLQEWVKKNGDPKLKPIVQLDKITGKMIREFESVKQASEQVGTGRTNITNCLTGYSKSAGGFIWVYLKDFPK